ncbi:MAG: hypothetical protein MI924_12550 [Chloroflexales bacterium]|nr:hypothetical protein [Chloroflexales bacterium]
MPSNKPGARAATGTPGTKMLISASALAATLGGWALFTLADNDNTTEASVPQPVIINTAPAPTQPNLTLDLAPIPTVVPPLNLPPIPVQNPPAAPPAVAPPAAPPPALREVSPPPAPVQPAPVTTTRSSR